MVNLKSLLKSSYQSHTAWAISRLAIQINEANIHTITESSLERWAEHIAELANEVENKLNPK